MMRLSGAFGVVALLWGLWGCVYQVGLREGKVYSEDPAPSLSFGMSREDVLYLLGSPNLKKPLNLEALEPERWDYYYSLRSLKEKEADAKDFRRAYGPSQHLILWFGPHGTLVDQVVEPYRQGPPSKITP